MHQTLDQIRREGLKVLRQHLGRAGLIRFLQQFEFGEGDYSVERHDWVDRTSLADIKSLSDKRGRRARVRRR